MQRCANALAGATMMMTAVFLPLKADATPIAAAIHSGGGDKNGAQPIEKIACWGWGWRGPGVYVSPLGLRAACWDAPVYGPPAYVAPEYIPPVVVAPAAPAYVQGPTWYYCDNPKGYYPSVPACATGWRVVAASP